MQFIDLQAQYQHLKDKINTRISNVLEHGKFILGPEVHELEERLAEYVGVKHVVSCANGTDALQLCMMLLDIKEGDAVFCPTFTFFATAEVIAFAGATPIFVDSDPDTFNISAEDLERQIQKVKSEGKLQPKAVIAVDLFGLPADYRQLEPVVERHGLKLIEDAAQGMGGSINGKMAGSFGDLATTSFFPAKPLGCYGDGGAIFTDNDEYAEILRSLRMHGKGRDKYHNVRIGTNSRLDTIQAAILLEKLAVFPKEIELRNQFANHYTESLEGLSQLKIPKVALDFTSSWAQYTLVVNDGRDQLAKKLASAGVPSAIYYDVGMHNQPVFGGLNKDEREFPVASSWEGNVISLPMHPYMQTDDLKKVVDAIKDK